MKQNAEIFLDGGMLVQVYNFKYLMSCIISGGRYTGDVKCRIPQENISSDIQKHFLEIRKTSKKNHLEHTHIWLRILVPEVIAKEMPESF